MPDGSRRHNANREGIGPKMSSSNSHEFPLDQGEVPKLSPRRQLHLLFGETGFPALLHLLFQMKLQLLSELIFLASSAA
jgi:hypothetical protein